jgi:hypothetical protein
MNRLVIVFVLVIGGFVLLAVAVAAGALAIPAAGAAVGVLAAVGVVVLAVAVFVDLVTPAPGACGLVRRLVFRDRCGGGCPAGQVCVVTTTRPYGVGRLGLGGPLGGVQAAACACAVPLTPIPGIPGAGGGAAGPPGQGGG